MADQQEEQQQQPQIEQKKVSPKRKPRSPKAKPKPESPAKSEQQIREEVIEQMKQQMIEKQKKELEQFEQIHKSPEEKKTRKRKASGKEEISPKPKKQVVEKKKRELPELVTYKVEDFPKLKESGYEAICMKCSYEKGVDGHRIFEKFHESKKTKSGNPKKIYKSAKRVFDVTDIDNKTMNQKTLRLCGECRSCKSKVSCIVEKVKLFPLEQQQQQ